MKIDAHQHYWKIERNDYGWLKPESKVLYRDYLPEDLKPHLVKNQIDKTIVVQAAPTIAETEFLLGLCEQNDTIAGVVGWIDLEDEQFADQFERLNKNPYFVGIRPMIQDIEDDKWLLRPRVQDSIQLLMEAEFPFDLLVLPRHLPHVLTLLEKFPQLRGVIDHLAKPKIATGVLEPWKEHMAEIAQNENIYCKLSGMVTEADHANWKAEQFEPYVHHVIEAFGTKRVMFGSDWPVCLLAADYTQVCDILTGNLPEGLSEQEKSDVFGGNAARFYKV